MPSVHRTERSDTAPRFRAPALRGLIRTRVNEAIAQAVENHPMALVVAPAGSGKTTAMVQFTESSDRTCTWYLASSASAHPADLLTHLLGALQHVVGGLPADLDDVERAGTALARVPSPRPTLLVIDDLHELAGSAAEPMLESFVRALPPWLRVLAATRHTPGFNHSALRITENLAEIPADVLRWRPWEVERLFRDHYNMRLRPEEAARLTQRTEGWAAGLQLFHLASQHLPLARRTQLMDELHTRPGLVRDYLTHNVLAGLPAQLRSFLIDTCVLGWLNAPLCDRLRGRTDSASFLAELADKRLFLLPREGSGYRYHEVLRAHLEVCLLERDGTGAMRARFHRAGALLEAEDAAADALHAYARAEAWDDVARLLGTDGPTLARGGRSVLSDLPESLISADPWLRLAQARALLADGQLRPALEAYLHAEQVFGDLPGAVVCRDERAAIRPWVDGPDPTLRGLTDILRAAIWRDPRRYAQVAAAADTPSGLLVGSVAMLLAGSVDEAGRLAARAGARPDAEVFTLAIAQVLEHVADMAGGRRPTPADLPWAAETLEHLGSTWLARLVRTIASCQTPDGLAEVADTLVDSDVDPWGPPLLRLIAGIAAVIHGKPQPGWFETIALDFRRLDAGTLEAWARAWGALARAAQGDPEPMAFAEQARSLARHNQIAGAEAIAELAIAVASPDSDAGLRAAALARELGLALPALDHRADGIVEIASVDAPSTIRCLGGMELTLAGRRIDLTSLKPQTRAVLAMVAKQAGTAVHRDLLGEALWPDEDPDTTHRRLPVLISTVRRHLEPDAEPGHWSLLVRRGEGYVLQPPESTYVDVRALDDAVVAARLAHSRHDREQEMVAYQTVLDAYRGPLLPEFGAAEWLLADRDHYEVAAVLAAQELAAWHLAGNDPTACIDVARAGLRVDRYRSQLWRLLAEAHHAVGDLAAAANVESEHRAILEELGIIDVSEVGSR